MHCFFSSILKEKSYEAHDLPFKGRAEDRFLKLLSMMLEEKKLIRLLVRFETFEAHTS